jgi:hypothetical protein
LKLKNEPKEERKVLKAKAIIFATDFTGEIKEAGVNVEGKMIVDGNEFDLDKVKPLLIEEKPAGGAIKRMLSKGKIVPYYFLKYNTVMPMMTRYSETPVKFNVTCSKCGNLVATYPAMKKTVEALDMKSYKTLLPPDLMRETVEMRFLKVLKKYSDRQEKTKVDRSMLLRFGIPIIGGIVLWYVLIMFKILPPLK